MQALQPTPAALLFQSVLGPAALASSQRLLSVLSWGRNVEGQCGVESLPLVTRPTPLLELHGSPVVSVHAGKLNSGAILSSGEAWTWGDGKSGKLGHGNTEHVKSPARIESLWGRAEVTSMALGDAHTLYLDSYGSIWSCGENKEGQCGLGTPLEVIAQQHRKSFYDSMRQWEGLASRSSSAAFGHDASSNSNRDKFSRYLRSLMDSSSGGGGGDWQQQQRQEMRLLMKSGGAGQQRAARHAYADGGGAPSLGSSFGLNFSFGATGVDVESHLQSFGLQPGQSHTPQRVGRDQHPLMDHHFSSLGKGGGGLHGGPLEEAARAAVAQQAGIEQEAVLGVAATKYFSIALTSSGEVWSFGACYNGSLGGEHSWSTSARKVCEDLSASIAERGGATKVAAGGTFAMCLTASGKVLVWGKLGGGSPGAGLPAASAAGAGDGEVVYHEVQGLPPLRDISAGHQHALLTDGERVWAIGRWLGATGEEAGSATCAAPKEMLHLPAEGITRVAAGAHASAAISGDGRLHMWGRLLDSLHVDGLFRKFHGDVDTGNVDWSWPGFGGAAPALVPGLEGVRDVALGGWHALVLVD